MTDTQLSPDRTDQVVARRAPDHRATRRFRGSTYEDAVEAAMGELGPELHVLEANRIRRGGLGGFFATDLGVEVTVATDHPATNPDAVGRADRPGDPSARADAGIDAASIRPYLPEDLTGADSEDGSLPGQSLGMTDAGVGELVARADRAERESLPRRRPGGDVQSFADHYVRELHGDPSPVAVAGVGRAGPVPRATGEPPASSAAVAGAQVAAASRSAAATTDESGIVAPVAPGVVADGGEALGRPGVDAAGDPVVVDPIVAGPPVVAGSDRPRLPAVLRLAVARRAPSGFLDDYPAEAAPPGPTDPVDTLEVDPVRCEAGDGVGLVDANDGAVEAGDADGSIEVTEPAAGAGLADGIAIADGSAEGAEGVRPVADAPAGGLDGVAPAPHWAAVPTLPTDPTRPLMGTVRRVDDSRRSDGGDPTIDRTALEGTADTGASVAVVVPMGGSIDEPMSRLVTPPRSGAVPVVPAGAGPAAPAVAMGGDALAVVGDDGSATLVVEVAPAPSVAWGSDA